MMSAGVCQKIFRFIEWANLESFGHEQVLHRFEDGKVVVYQTDLICFRVTRLAHAAALLF
jgi:hypothetical protein